MDHSAHHDAGHSDGAHVQGSLKDYSLGFILSVILTAIPFWLVMSKVAPPPVTAAIVIAMAVIQIVVHMIFFLHMNTRSEGGWTMLALIFTIILVVIAVSGSIWVMHHLNSNMSPMHAMEAAP